MFAYPGHRIAALVLFRFRCRLTPFWLARRSFSALQIIPQGGLHTGFAFSGSHFVSHDCSLCPETVFSSVSA